MKTLKLFNILASFLIVFIFISCEGLGDLGNVDEEDITPEIEIITKDLAIEIGDSIQLEYNINPTTLEIDDLVWTSLSDSIITINENGILHAIGLGLGYFRLSSETYQIMEEASILVSPVYLSAIAFPDPVTIGIIGEQKALELIYTPEDATDKSLTWRSSNTRILSVDQNGIINTKELGQVFVEAYKENSNLYDAVHIIPANNNQIAAANYSWGFNSFDDIYFIKVYFGSITESVTVQSVTLYSTYGFTFDIDAELKTLSMNEEVNQNEAILLAEIELTEEQHTTVTYGSMIRIVTDKYTIDVNGNMEIQFP